MKNCESEYNDLKTNKDRVEQQERGSGGERSAPLMTRPERADIPQWESTLYGKNTWGSTEGLLRSFVR